MNRTIRPHILAPIIGVLLAFTAVSCGSTAILPDHDRALAHRMVDEEGAVLLDVRMTMEFAGGHIEGATNIPVEELAERMGEVEALTNGDKGYGIVVYCRAGRRAGQAKVMLTQRGYSRVTNLGGYGDW